MSMTPRTDSDALLPCPFCGNATNFWARGIDGMPYCGECGAQPGRIEWNTRADNPELAALRKERDALKEALDEIAHMGHDAPMTWGGSDLDWANRRAGLMQSIARSALATEGQP